MTEEFKQLERKRAAAKGWVSRSANALTSLLNKPDVSKLELEDAILDFDRRLQALDDAQAAVESGICEADQMEADIEAADQYRRQVRSYRLQAVQALDKITRTDPGEPNHSEVGSTDSVLGNVKLPRIELPRFSGDVLEWQSFWEQFEALVGQATIPDISKFGYLQSSLDGEAKRVIQGLPLTAANYPIACSVLRERFGKPTRIIFAHIQALLNTSLLSKSTGNKYIASLWKLHDQLNTHVRSLEALGVEGTQYGVVLTPVILSRLPHDIRMEWSREGLDHESDLSWLMSFLQREIERRERSDAYREGRSEEARSGSRSEEARGAPGRVERRKILPGTASALQTSSVTSVGRCGFCNKSHQSEKCYSVSKLTRAEREEKVRSADLCFRCLVKGHVSKGCKSKCTKCKGNHNVLFCLKEVSLASKDSEVNDEPERLPSSESKGVSGDKGTDLCVSQVGVALSRPDVVSKEVNRTCVLQTAKVRLYGNKGQCVTATVLFDTGSDRSYVTSSLVRKVRPKWMGSEPITYSAFGSKMPKNHTCNLFDLTLTSYKGVEHSLVAVEVPTICAPLLRSRVPSDRLLGLESLHFADDYVNNRQITVDILVGMDAYWKLVIPNKTIETGGLVTQESVFGWILSGSMNASGSHEGVSTQLLCIDNNISDSVLHKFWDLESIGICSVEPSCKGSTLQRFEESVKFCNDRYEVALPWKSDVAKSDLQNNVKLARKRLDNLCRRFDKDPCLKMTYDSVFIEYEQEGICEEVPPSELESIHPTYYLPHRPVVRESSSSTRVRPVFDASAAGYNGISLNDCLETGPSLNPDLVAILLRFRRWPIALTADITKAFLQISVRQEDRDVHRFLWKPEDRVRTMRFNRVPFGNKSSPFLLNATIKHHLNLCPQSDVVQELKENLYVDDWLTGAESINEGQAMFIEAAFILGKAGMTLSKWTSSNKYLVERFSDNSNFVSDKEAVKILGMNWNMLHDYFSFDGFSIDSPLELIVTKRAVLSCLARVFDPLGLLSPFTMVVKILFQQIWRLGTGWDETLPDELLFRFQTWFKGIPAFQLWRVDRCYFPGSSWTAMTGVELHGFGDASEKAYGACVYLRLPLPDGNFKVSLVMSKGRVAPIKALSLPRLELLSAVLCCRLVNFVMSALHLDVPVFCWTDSTVTLSWIKGDPHRWKTFVKNRVTEIQDLVSPEKWFHCPGKDNPADLISRGVLAEQLVSACQWLNGPAWLSFPLNTSCQEQQILSCDNGGKAEAVSCVSVNIPSVVFELTRWSSFCKAVNIVAWTLRFITNCNSKAKKCSGSLTYEELTQAKVKLFCCVQREVYSREIGDLQQCKPLSRGSPLKKLDPFLDRDGLLRIKGRLHKADMTYESKHPIIIPPGHVARLIVQFQHTLLKHAGVSTLLSTLRNSYWIIGLRKLAKSICRMCIPCRRHDSKPCSQPAAPLPELRVKPSPPFSVTGLDYAGPLYCTDMPSKKLYILLFTCAVIRAIHLELTDSLSLSDCNFAIRRFAARRGFPSVFYSDNAQTFVAVSLRLRQNFGPFAPNWKFIVPRAPWWGGWWERLIRSVKSSLRKTFGVRRLSRCELETTLCEVEACVNSRPLTFVGDEVDATPPLTPSHFLIGRPAGVKVEGVENQGISECAHDLHSREQVRLERLDKFWKIWSSDYIRNLPPTFKGFLPKCNVKKGSVVLVKEDNVPRMSWPLGVVEETFPGHEGIIRSVNVRTSRGVVCRPVQKLHELEISSPIDVKDVKLKSDSSEINVSNGAQAPSKNVSSNDCFKVVYTRVGRAVKPPMKLDL